jgi:hypothetical protein
MPAIGIAAGVGAGRLATLTPSVAEDALIAKSTQGPQCEEEPEFATADAAREAVLAPSEQPSGPLTSMATRPSPSKQSTTPSSNPAKPSDGRIAVSARRRGTDLLTVPILIDREYRASQPPTQAPRRHPGTDNENAPDPAAEGVHFYWSTRPGSLARAASRRALCASRAKLGREPAFPSRLDMLQHVPALILAVS